MGQIRADDGFGNAVETAQVAQPVGGDFASGELRKILQERLTLAGLIDSFQRRSRGWGEHDEVRVVTRVGYETQDRGRPRGDVVLVAHSASDPVCARAHVALGIQRK